ncbi:MAG: hypothetical protein ATN36_07505 [Epulopiscium sp. Nele67-Bin005]|nr:MAG: hypothetical protein ATN36_07505 [Epulopiscium sp. Nele67-Bin005]
MNLSSIFMIGVGLSADAFAVSICKGLSMKKMYIKDALIIAIYFGVFQALMPLIGFVLGTQFSNFVNNIGHWLAFAILTYIGLNLIKSGNSKEEDDGLDMDLSIKVMVSLAIATSIDALAVGVTFAFLQVEILLAILIIGLTTFIICLFGVKVGNIFGIKYKSKAEILGGIILILIGTSILIT